MTIDAIVPICFVIFLCLGAFFGWKAGSKISLLTGLSSGALVFVGSWIAFNNHRGGFTFLSIIGGILAVVFLIRLIKTKKMMPAGMLMIVSLAFLGFCITRF